jgi:hypothetical protein
MRTLCGPGARPLNNDRIAAYVCPVPSGVVDRHMNVSNPGRHGKRGRSKYGHYMQVLGAILDDYSSLGKFICKRRIDHNPSRRLISFDTAIHAPVDVTRSPIIHSL